MLFNRGEREIIPFITVLIALLCFVIEGWWILVIYSFLLFMMLGVPCGIKCINRNSFLWSVRQVLFFILAVGILISAVGLL